MIPQNIHRSQDYESLVQRLSGVDGDKNLESNQRLFPTIREFLSFAGLLGFSEGRKIPFDRTSTEDIAGAQYLGQAAMEIIHAIAVAETNTVDILLEQNEKECAEIFEDYVNGGLQIIQEWIVKHPDLPPYKAIQSGMLSYKFIEDENAQLNS